jgi:hypothetical protein
MNRRSSFHTGLEFALPTLRQWLLAGLFCLMGSSVMASQTILELGGVPVEYRLDEVSIRLSREHGHGFSPQRVMLAGTGQAMLERGGQNLPFHYPNADLMALLNELYRIRFFTMPTSYTTQYSIFLKDDGTVSTSILRMQDASSTTLCFAVADFEKCVSFSLDGPRELDELAKRIFSEADAMLVKQKLPK